MLKLTEISKTVISARPSRIAPILNLNNYMYALMMIFLIHFLSNQSLAFQAQDVTVIHTLLENEGIDGINGHPDCHILPNILSQLCNEENIECKYSNYSFQARSKE